MTKAGALLPWDALMRLGLGHLRLAPAVFWSMTLRELAWAAGREAQAATFDRSALEALMARFPDEPRPHTQKPDES